MYPGERKPPYYLITGLVIGVVLGVLFGWILFPVEPIDLAPETLRDDFKDEYRELIAFAYLSNGDIGRAESLLNLLGEDNHARTLEIQAQEAMGQFGQEHIVRALGLLAEKLMIQAEITPQLDLTEQSQVDSLVSPTASLEGGGEETAEPQETARSTEVLTATPTPTGIFLPTATQIPTDTPTAAPDATEEAETFFLVIKQEKICDSQENIPRLEIYVFSNNKQIPWVEIEVNWVSGSNRFFTGLNPEKGPGYADFVMDQQIFYNLSLSESSETLEDISWAECEGDDGINWWGSWEIHFSTDH